MQKTIEPGRHRTLPRAVARAILEDLAASRLKAGGRIGEAAYSAQCEVSRTPVRRALDMLCDAGLAERRGRQGCFAVADRVQAKKALAAQAFHLDDTRDSAHGNGTDPTFIEVARRIRTLLADPAAFPQDVLKDAAVARRLGVSRTTATRALGQLARENLVQPLPRRGWKRTMLGPESFLHWYEFRLAVEPPALESGFPYLEAAAVDDLLHRTKAVLAKSRWKRMERQALADLDAELHQMILHACRNPFLKSAMEQQEALRYIAGAPTWNLASRVKETFEEHLVILEAIRLGNSSVAVGALHKHLRCARDEMAAAHRRHASKGT